MKHFANCGANQRVRFVFAAFLYRCCPVGTFSVNWLRLSCAVFSLKTADFVAYAKLHAVKRQTPTSYTYIMYFEGVNDAM